MRSPPSRCRRRSSDLSATARRNVTVPCSSEKRYNVRVDDEQGTVTFRRAVALAAEPLPKALIPPEPFPTWTQRDAVLRFAQSMDSYPALVGILVRRPPRARLDGSLEEAALSLD